LETWIKIRSERRSFNVLMQVLQRLGLQEEALMSDLTIGKTGPEHRQLLVAEIEEILMEEGAKHLLVVEVEMMVHLEVVVEGMLWRLLLLSVVGIETERMELLVDDAKHHLLSVEEIEIERKVMKPHLLLVEEAEIERMDSLADDVKLHLLLVEEIEIERKVMKPHLLLVEEAEIERMDSLAEDVKLHLLLAEEIGIEMKAMKHHLLLEVGIHLPLERMSAPLKVPNIWVEWNA